MALLLERLLFFWSIFLLNVLLVNCTMLYQLHRLHDSACADYGNPCNPNSSEPCCNSRLICRSIGPNKNFECTDKMQLGQNCETNEDCSKYIFHAKCSKQKKCACEPGSIQVSKNVCSPLLGEFCQNNEVCEPENSICDKNLCICDYDYFQYSNTECLPIVLLGTPCKNDTTCKGVNHAKCSDKMFCECSPNTFRINLRKCKINLDFICESDSQCEDNQVCINHRCKCNFGWRLGSENECILVRLGMNCTRNEECSNSVKHSICSEKKVCECERFYHRTEDLFCASDVNDACKNTNQCKNDIALCYNDECHCQPNYVYDGSKCVLPY